MRRYDPEYQKNKARVEEWLRTPKDQRDPATIAELCRLLGISRTSFYHWRDCMGAKPEGRATRAYAPNDKKKQKAFDWFATPPLERDPASLKDLAAKINVCYSTACRWKRLFEALPRDTPDQLPERTGAFHPTVEDETERLNHYAAWLATPSPLRSPGSKVEMASMLGFAGKPQLDEWADANAAVLKRKQVQLENKWLSAEIPDVIAAVLMKAKEGSHRHAELILQHTRNWTKKHTMDATGGIVVEITGAPPPNADFEWPKKTLDIADDDGLD